MAYARSSNLYGSKTLAPQRKGLLNSTIGATPVGYAWDIINGFRQEGRANRFQRDVVDPLNRRGQQLLDRAGRGYLGGSPIAYGDEQAQRDVTFADSAFGDLSIRNLGESQYARVRAGLNALPGRIAGQTSGAVGELRTSAGDINRQFRAGASSLGSEFGGLSGDVTGGYGALSEDVGAGYQERLDRARGIVSGMSDQEAKDANRRFSEESAGETARLVSQGLSGSGVGASVRGGIEGRRSDELRRIADARAMRELGVEETFGGAGLAAQERLGVGRLGAQQEVGLAGLAERGVNVRYGTEVAARLADSLAARGIDAARLNSDTGLESLRQQGAISQSEFDALQNARRTRLDTRTGRTQAGVTARQNVFGTAASFYGGPYVYPPA